MSHIAEIPSPDTTADPGSTSNESPSTRRPLDGVGEAGIEDSIKCYTDLAPL